MCDNTKRRELFDFLKNSGLTFVFLQETKFCPLKHDKYGEDWHNPMIFLNSVRSGEAGTGILCNSLSIKVLNRLEDDEGRIIVLDVDVFGSKFHLVNTYFPNEPYLKNDFITKLYPYLSSNYPVMWCGDYNIATNPKIDRLPSANAHDYCGADLKELVEYYNFTDVCRYLYPNRKIFTYKGLTGQSRIDKILISPNIAIVSYDQLDMLVSDHDLIMAQVQYKSMIKWGKSRWRNNCSIYNDTDFLEKHKVFWILESQNVSRVRNPNKWWINTKYQFKLKGIKQGMDTSIKKKRQLQMMESGLQGIGLEILNDPNNLALYKKYDSIKKDLAKKQLENVKEKIFKEKASNILHGPKPTKQFFMKYRKKITKQYFKCLKDENGVPNYEINQILNIVEQHFERIFGTAGDDDNDEMQFFLNETSQISELGEHDLTCNISMSELGEVMGVLPDGKMPGPDGQSYEYYKKIFKDDFFKDKLLVILNNFLHTARNTGKLPAKFVEGVISLVGKRDPLDEIENYRAITLLNCDLKILTKIISNRLKPLLGKILHPTQFAQPGHDINLLNAQIRDVFYDMENSDHDSFFVSVDFKCAFDKVSHSFLFKVLKKLGFQGPFINFVKALYHNASSTILINGYKTKKIKIKSGIRQGCTFSRDLFTFSLNPLLQYLNKCERIQKYKCLSNEKILTSCFTDDLNLFTESFSSLLTILFYILKYKKASGLELNFAKTKGIFFNKRNVINVEHLPKIQWVTNVKILGIHYGKSEFINSQWVDKVKEIKEEIHFYNSTGRQTLQEKAILSKSKLLPVLSYVCNVHVIPDMYTKQIDVMLLKFIVSHDKSLMELYEFASNKSLGGYCVDHITLHASLFLLRPVLLYIKLKAANEALPYFLHYIEYYLGWQLCALYDLPKCTSKIHALMPNNIYECCYKMLNDYGITLEECQQDHSFSRIYHRIVNDYSEKRRRGNAKLYRIHYKCLPEYLKSFNYKLYFNLLPLNTKFVYYCLDTDSRCYFCKWGPENEWHLFGKCKCLKPLWQALDEVIKIALNIPYSFIRNRTQIGDYDVVSTQCVKEYEGTLVYLNTIVNHKIYKIRNELKYEGGTFKIEELFNKILRSVTARKNIEKRLTEIVKVPKIEELYRALVFVKNLVTNQQVANR